VNVVRFKRNVSDEELLEAATAHRDELFNSPSCKELEQANFLSMDYMISAPLEGILRFNGCDCTLGESIVKLPKGYAIHTWIKLADGRVLDATADAFNDYPGYEKMDKIYLGPPLKIHRELEDED
jgi:hypothetical protein